MTTTGWPALVTLLHDSVQRQNMLESYRTEGCTETEGKNDDADDVDDDVSSGFPRITMALHFGSPS